jgi:glycosyltransferase involved in cell wall biosynthesis
MKIAIYYPSQSLVAKDLLFTQYTEHEFVKNLCTEDCDLIYCCSSSVLGSGLAAKKKFNKPLVSWCWDIPDNWQDWEMPQIGFNENSHRDIKNKQTIANLKKCDLVISASKYTQKTLKKYGVESEQMYFYINTHELDKAKDIGFQRKIVSQVSRYYWNKKFEHTIEAAKDLDCNTLFHGNTLNSNYGRYLQGFDRGNLIMYENQSRESTINLINSSTVLVSPSCFEGWGITPIEAIYLGTPILTSAIEPFIEVYGADGYYHKTHDVSDMTEKLDKLLNERQLRISIITRNQIRIKEFNPKRFAKQWERLITQL